MVQRNRRFSSKANSCPVCAGWESAPRGQGVRCTGFLSEDDHWCRCAREEFAGGIQPEDSAAGPVYRHMIGGACNCGVTHAPPKPRVYGAGGKLQIIAEYDYRDETGSLLYQCVRCKTDELPKTFRQRAPDSSARNGWRWTLGKTRLVLYRLPQLLAADPSSPVYLVEGEKDAEACERAGLVATTAPMGAGKWRLVEAHARQVLAGRDVVVVADADPDDGDREGPGRPHARAVEASLRGHARSIRALEPPPPHKDAAEMLAAGLTMSELVPLRGPPVVVASPPLRTAEGATATQLAPGRGAATIALTRPRGQPAVPSPPAPGGAGGAGEGAGQRQERVWERGDHVELGQALLADLRRVGPVVCCESALWRYGPRGIYEQVSEADQSVVVQGYAGEPVAGAKGDRPLLVSAGDVGGASRLAAHRVTDLDFFREAPAGLVFSNGFVHVDQKSVTLRGHSAEHRARFAYPFAFERRAPKLWLEFLHGVFRDDPDREEKIQLVHEFFGAALLGLATRFDQALILHGVGDDGKSTTLDILKAAFPAGSIASVPPHKLSGISDSCDYFRAMLSGKLLNVVSELPEADIFESTGFKAVTSGDEITARNPAKPGFQYRPIAGHAYAANTLPSTNDQTPGFWRRFIILKFNRSFSGDSMRDPMIDQKIISSELPAIVSTLIDAGQRLISQRGYTVPASHGAALRAWQLSSDTVRQFVDECCTAVVAPAGTTSAEIYVAYQRWAQGAGLRKPLSRNALGRRLALAGVGRVHGRDGAIYSVVLRASNNSALPSWGPRSGDS
jgi:P4 family phage/plasmid primase-like protien